MRKLLRPLATLLVAAVLPSCASFGPPQENHGTRAAAPRDRRDDGRYEAPNRDEYGNPPESDYPERGYEDPYALPDDAGRYDDGAPREEVKTRFLGVRQSLRFNSLAPYPISFYFGGGRHEGSVGFLSISGLLTEDDVSDPLVDKVDDKYTLLEANYAYYLSETAPAGTGLWVGGGLGLSRLSVDETTTDGFSGSAEMTAFLIRLGSGYRWVFGALETGLDAGFEYQPAADVSITVKKGTQSRSDKSSMAASSGVYGGFSIALRF